MKPTELQEAIEELQASEQWRLIYCDSGFYLFKRDPDKADPQHEIRLKAPSIWTRSPFQWVSSSVYLFFATLFFRKLKIA
jgi:hypothetical protein